jgi:hypothetical protein
MTKKDWKSQLKEYSDLYGMEVTHLLLQKKGYTMISMAKNSIPTAGSNTIIFAGRGKKAVLKKPFFEMEIKSVKTHNNGDITLETNRGFFKYSK